MTSRPSPFHAGELEAQRLAEAGDVTSWAGGFIRDHMPDQHRDFFTALPFLVITSSDEDGWPWVTILEGAEGFIRSPDPLHLTLAAMLPSRDPLAGALVPGAAIGMLGIDLATRRRNRMNGVISSAIDGFAVEVKQSFGNCPQYIHERAWRRVAPQGDGEPSVSHHLDAGQQARIAAADTFFIGTGHGAGKNRRSDGYDTSHRGGPRGFVRVSENGRCLQIPDYAGNNYFNTIGNLILNSRVGLLFVDFRSGGLLHITGRATIDWTPTDGHDQNARRIIDVTIEKVIDRPAALTLRWSEADADRQKLQVVAKVPESDRITSFHLASTDGKALPRFEAGQNLAVELEVPGLGRVGRSYSLSGAPDAGVYRISVKREDKGIASGFLHSQIGVGDTVEVRPPSGEFVVPDGTAPLVLISAGVGITPMISILHDEAARGSTRPILFAHVARDGENHAFRAEIDALLAHASGIRRLVFYTRPRDADIRDVNYDRKGRLTADDILSVEGSKDAHYMLCGPARFLADTRLGLERSGVPQSRIHFETFGPSA